MIQIRVMTAAVVLAACAGRLQGQSLLDRPPNLSGGWLGAPGTVQFNFVHRFTISTPPARKVSNSPTFFFSYRLPLPLMVGVNYATSSDVSPNAVNEFEGFARYARTGTVAFAWQLGYNQAAKSVDGEVTLAHTIQRLRLIAVGRAFSHPYGLDTARLAVGGGEPDVDAAHAVRQLAADEAHRDGPGGHLRIRPRDARHLRRIEADRCG